MTQPAYLTAVRSLARTALVCCTLLAALPAYAEFAVLDDRYSLNDYGGIGLVQMPSARFSEDGQVYFGGSFADPYISLYATAQFLPWLEGTFRYLLIENRRIQTLGEGGDKAISQDRQFDLKIRLWEETRYIPQVAVGLRDFIGTGLFSSEYWVASKHWQDFDFTLGMGWGRMGARAHFDNPYSSIADRFDNRDTDFGQGGKAEVDTIFRGKRVALFGGVEWYTPIDGLRVKLEYDGNDYESEPLDNNQEVDSPINAAVSYRVLDRVDLQLGIERGNTVTVNANTFLNLEQDSGPPKFGRSPPALRSRLVESASEAPRDEQSLVRTLEAFIHNEGFTLHAVDPQPYQLSVWFSQSTYRNSVQAVGRVARILTQLAPDSMEKFRIVVLERDTAVATFNVQRAALENLLHSEKGLDQLWRGIKPRPGVPASQARYSDLRQYPHFYWEFNPRIRQNIGGLDTFYAAQLYLNVDATLQLYKHLFVEGGLGINIVDNLDELGTPSNSTLPHVRSDIVLYLTEGKNFLDHLYTHYLWSPMPQVYSRVGAGIFENMYGGVAAEVLYQPYESRWAIGAEINRVRQRDFDQRFDFRDYEVTTGHLTGYYQSSFYGLLGKLSVGQYLARDTGATLDISRRFKSGAKVGGFVTKTDVSSEEFGEGSFDKGIYISLPLDMFFTRNSRGSLGALFRPLTRDGGAKVYTGVPLYDMVNEHTLHRYRESKEAFLE